MSWNESLKGYSGKKLTVQTSLFIMLSSWNGFVFDQGFFYLSAAVWGSLLLAMGGKKAQANATTKSFLAFFNRTQRKCVVKALLEWKYQAWVPALTATLLQVQRLPIFTPAAPMLTGWHLDINFFVLPLACLCFRSSLLQEEYSPAKALECKPWLKKASKSTSRVVLTIGN